jgi:NAD(P)-dependent dehydrogenase (short-subunit alcohol dehydrogenase family)
MTQGMFDLTGRIAVVIGGTTGLGHAIAIGLAQAGADVVATSRRRKQVELTAAEIESLGRNTVRETSDVANRESLSALHAAVLAEFQKVDILVNAAGLTFKNSPSPTGSASSTLTWPARFAPARSSRPP